MKRLDKRVIWLFFLPTQLSLLLTLLTFRIFFSYIFIGQQFDGLLMTLPSDIALMINYWWVIYAFVAILGYVWSYLTWYFYKYELTEDGFKKELGIVFKQYVTIPYERIQNVDIYRGLWSRILGISDLQVQTAGMSSSIGAYGAGSEGRLPGLSREDAEKLRDALVKRAKGRSGGV